MNDTLLRKYAHLAWFLLSIWLLTTGDNDRRQDKKSLYRLFQITLSVFPSSSDASNHFHIEIPSHAASIFCSSELAGDSPQTV